MKKTFNRTMFIDNLPKAQKIDIEGQTFTQNELENTHILQAKRSVMKQQKISSAENQE